MLNQTYDRKRLISLFDNMDKENLVPSTINDRILVIDGMNLFIRNYTVNTTMNENGDHIGGITGFLLSLGYMIKILNPTRCIITFDGSGGSQRRRKIYPQYKANRKSKIVLNRKFDYQTDQEAKESMLLQIRRLIDYLDVLPVQILALDNIEADDTIAYIVTNFFQSENTKFTIVSTDKDFIQLVNDNVEVWNPQTKTTITNEYIKDRFFTSSKNFILGKIVDGDPSDNIPGVIGLSYKTLNKAIPRLVENDEITFDEFFTIINETPENKTCKKLLDNKSLLELNYKLMQLKNVDISGSSKEIIRNKILNSDVPILNKFQFQAMVYQDKLYAGIKNSDEWLNDVFFKINSFALRQQRK